VRFEERPTFLKDTVPRRKGEIKTNNPNREMKYIKPHLSPELRAQITPSYNRDRKLALAGVVFLLLSGILAGNLLYSGKQKAPSVTVASLNTSNTLPSSPEERQVLGLTTQEQPFAPQEYTTYTVKNGDTLFNISQQYNIRWDLIAQLNGLSEPYILRPNDSLKIPQATTSQVPGKIYTVKAGDTLADIAKQFNITTADIIAVNPNLQRSDLITPGQVVRLP
jgi:LysM repeat protein